MSTPTGTRRSLTVVLITLVLGAAQLAAGLNTPSGSFWFYLFTTTLALTWVVGAMVAADDRGLSWFRRSTAVKDVGTGLAVGAVLVVTFLLGAGIIVHIPWALEPVQNLLDHARWGALLVVALITTVNGVSEEIYFRGAFQAAVPGNWLRRVGLPTLAYTLVTLTSGVVMLGLAAAMLGLATALLRERTGALWAPVMCHLVWSLSMLFLLPPALDFWM